MKIMRSFVEIGEALIKNEEITEEEIDYAKNYITNEVMQTILQLKNEIRETMKTILRYNGFSIDEIETVIDEIENDPKKDLTLSVRARDYQKELIKLIQLHYKTQYYTEFMFEVARKIIEKTENNEKEIKENNQESQEEIKTTNESFEDLIGEEND